MQPRIEILPEKRLIGKSIRLSFDNNKTALLWQNFMPSKKDIINTMGTELYSIEVYPSGYFENFNPATEFDKWAAIEVSNSDNMLPGMETLLLPRGLYAIFTHKGPASEGARTYNYIFTQ